MPEAARDAYLTAELGHAPDLLDHVRALLGAHSRPQEAGSSQTQRLPEAAADDASASSFHVAVTAGGESSPKLPPGHMLGTRFRIVELLGIGGMGEVYCAEDLELGQTVAIKRLPRELAAEPAWLDRLRHEVRIARQITHPNVCRVYDIHEADGEHFLSMEFVDGENLRTLLRRIGRLSYEKALQVAQQLCAGLAAAHAKDILHRDLKPANIMLDEHGHVRIMDFGLASVREHIRRADIRSGTPAYMSPEQLAGFHLTVRSDLYALGLVLLELFGGESAAPANPAVMASLAESAAPPGLPADVDPRVEDVIARCLASNPSDRPDSALAVAAALPDSDVLALAAAAGATPTPSLVAGAGGQPAVTVGRAVSLLALLVAVVVLLAAMLSSAHPVVRAQMPKSPEVLADKARQLLTELGILPAAAHEACGLAEPAVCRAAWRHPTANCGRRHSGACCSGTAAARNRWPATMRCGSSLVERASPLRIRRCGRRVSRSSCSSRRATCGCCIMCRLRGWFRSRWRRR
jgi:serine/threonine-protein kinase